MAELPLLDNAVRRATEADLADLNRIMQGSSAYAGRYRPILDGYEITAGQLARDRVYLVERGGRVMGFYSLTAGDEPELDLMFVADAARGVGLGRHLFAHMREVAAAEGATQVAIVSHPPSAGFYRRMGAVRVSTRPPSGRVAWERPVLAVALSHPPREYRRA